MTPKEFCKITLPAAAEAANKYHVNPIAMIAQSALETGWGDKCPKNMYFGIKANHSWNGEAQLLWTTEYYNGEKKKVQQWFRAYPSATASFMDYAKLISSLNRYQSALQFFDYDDTDNYLRAVAAGGYATAPNYAESLIRVANTVKKYISREDLESALKKKDLTGRC